MAGFGGASIDDSIICTMDPSALFASFDNPVPTSSWTVSKNQPLEMVLMAKADLETVKIFYEFNPDALTKQLFRNVLKCGAKPGVVGFLAAQCPALVDKNALVLAMIQGPGPGRPTESEIITLAQINPELLVPKGPTFWMPGPLQLSLNWKYSPEFSQTLFKMLADTIPSVIRFPRDMILDLSSDYPWLVIDENSTTKRTALDMEAVMGMTPVLDSKNTHKFVSRCDKWQPKAFFDFVHRLLSNQSIWDLSLQFPDVSQKEEEQGKSMWFNTDAFKEVLSQCNIKCAALRMDQNNPFALDFLKNCLGSMPRLKKLKLHLGNDIALASATPVICHFLSHNSLLKVLIIIYAKSDTTTRGLDPILNSLANNHSLRAFHYFQHDAASDRFTRYHKVLADSLHKHNTTLANVGFHDVCSEDNPNGNLRSKLHPSDDLLAFYKVANRLGRKKAQEPETTVAEFVDLLGRAQNDDLNLGTDDSPCLASADDKFNILYGLLHENPAKWSHQTSNNHQQSTQSIVCGSKRKHSAMS